jgi:cell division protein FtsI/penicillin-binding protein 2
MYLVICGLFFILAVKLYNLQIINGNYYNNEVKGTTLRSIEVVAPRGSIYDRYGRPLAVNKSSFIVNLDPGVTVDNLNEVLSNLIDLLETNGETIETDFPITPESPHSFTYDGSTTKEKRWKNDMGLDENLTADEAFAQLREDFEIDSALSDEQASEIMALRCELYLKRFSKYVPVTIAHNISNKTVTDLNEQKSLYPCAYVDVEALREYPQKELFSHMLGYIGNITESELATYQKYNYKATDIVGKDGIEKSFELQLNGTDGIQYVEVDSLGRRISTVDSGSVDPVPGNNVFLSIDADLQATAYNALENALKDAQISRLTGTNKDYTYNSKQVLASMVTSDNIRIKDILAAEQGSVQYTIKEYIKSVDSAALEDTKLAAQIVADGLENDSIKSYQLILVLIEQGTISGDESYISKIRSGAVSPQQVIIDKLNSGELKPYMLNMDPCTGSVIVTDVDTGEVLAAVTYPSYDNNRLVNGLDNEYYTRLQNDPTTPLVNRPFQEPRAPGSIFKMITAIAGLEEGIIGPSTPIYDKGTFTEAGRPYARCWIGSGKGSHGSIDVSHALEVSCNYFFYTVAYNMGNSKSGTTLKGIETLNKYMKAFGLNDPTGVEIYEIYDSTKNYPSNISSPEYKRYVYTARNPETSESELEWRDGDTIRTAIGQSFNNYTAAIMSKYIATLANGGTRYTMHLLSSISTYNGDNISTYEPQVESTLDIKPQNLKAVYEGMRLVTQGTKGTLRKYFADFPINVAGKSGTAQEASYRSEHTTFVGFAPYEDPQISVAVIIPYGNNTTGPAPTVAKAVIESYLDIDSTPEKKYYNTLTQ